MPGPPERDAAEGKPDADTWPWRCLGCSGTIYHDVELCRSCHARARYRHELGGYGEASGRQDSPDGFVDWMRRQPASALSLKVSVIAGVELSLTTVWLQLIGLGGLSRLVPVGF